jgi:hypothetical protein
MSTPSTHKSPAIQKAVDTIFNTRLGSGFYLKERDARDLAKALDDAGVLKQRLR